MSIDVEDLRPPEPLEPLEYDDEAPAMQLLQHAEGALYRKFTVMNNFMLRTIGESRLTAAQALVWLALWQSTNSAGTVQMGQVLLASRLNLTKKTISNAVKELRGKGLLEVVRKGRNYGKITTRASVYRVRNGPLRGPTRDAFLELAFPELESVS